MNPLFTVDLGESRRALATQVCLSLGLFDGEYGAESEEECWRLDSLSCLSLRPSLLIHV